MRKVIVILAALAAIFIIAINLYLSNIFTPEIQAYSGYLHGPQEKGFKPSVHWIAGEFSFYPEAFLNGSQIMQAEPPDFIKAPGSWNLSALEGAYGFGTYHLRVSLRSGERYALYIPWVNTAYRLLVNGEVIESVGTIGTEKASHKPAYRPVLVSFTPKTPETDIILQVSNFSHQNGGLLRPIQLGYQTLVASRVSLQNSINLLIIGALIMAAAIAAIFFSSHHREFRLLYIAATSLLLALRISVGSSMILYNSFPNFPWFLGIRIEYAILPLAIFCFIGYFRHTYPNIYSGTFHKVFQWISAGSVILLFLIPNEALHILLQIYYASISAVIAVWIFYFFRNRLWKKKGETVSNTLLFFFGASVVFDILVAVSNTPLHVPIQISSIVLLFLIFIIIHRYTKQFLDALQYSQELAQELDEKVKLRTADLERMTEELYHLAVKDELTGLWNRNELQKRSEDESYRHNRYFDSRNPYFSVLYIDLDNFKYFNDTYTHEVGDHILQLFSDLIRKSSRKSDSNFRIGGDEFLMFLPKTDGAGAIRISRRILSGIKQCNREIEKIIQDRTGKDVSLPESLQLTCSIGIAVHGYEDLNIDRLIQFADTALLQAKISGKNQYHIYRKKDLEHL